MPTNDVVSFEQPGPGLENGLWPVVLWPNVPNFCLGPQEIPKIQTLVAHIFFGIIPECALQPVDSLAHLYFGLFSFWVTISALEFTALCLPKDLFSVISVNVQNFLGHIL